MTTLEALGRFAWSGPYLPELMAQKFFTLIPVWAFTPLFRTFGHNSKYYAFASMIAAEVTCVTLVGYVWRQGMRSRWPAGWGTARLVAAVAGPLAIVILLVLLPLLDAGVAGQAITGGGWVAVPTFAVVATCYATVLTRGIPR
jgi:hypothetical protein